MMMKYLDHVSPAELLDGVEAVAGRVLWEENSTMLRRQSTVLPCVGNLSPWLGCLPPHVVVVVPWSRHDSAFPTGIGSW